MPQTSSLPSGNGTKILIVSNSHGFLERNKRLLNGVGVRILTATSSREALEVHRKERVNLIIAMLDVPEAGGEKLCSLIRQEDELRNVSFILVRNHHRGRVVHTSQCGANVSFTRPVNAVLLRESVKRLLSISPRRDHRAIFKAHVRGTKESSSFTGISRNISASGILIESDRLLCENDLIKGMFVVSGSLLIVAEGKVVRSLRRQDGTYHYGVRFDNLEPEHRRAIEKYVANGT